jgi:hypothetical protein
MVTVVTLLYVRDVNFKPIPFAILLIMVSF